MKNTKTSAINQIHQHNVRCRQYGGSRSLFLWPFCQIVGGKKEKNIQNVVFDEFKANFLSYTMKDTLEGKLSLINSQKKNY